MKKQQEQEQPKPKQLDSTNIRIKLITKARLDRQGKATYDEIINRALDSLELKK